MIPTGTPALVMNHVLGGGGQQSRLFNEVREKRGLAYSVSSGLRTYKRAALLVMSTGSANDRIAEALGVIRAEMGRMRTEGVTESELIDAKTYLSGALALSLDSSGSIAGLLHSMQIDGLSPDHLTRRAALIAAVTLEGRSQGRAAPPARRSVDHRGGRQAGRRHTATLRRSAFPCSTAT